MVIGALMIVLGGGLFGWEVNHHISENAVLEGPTRGTETGTGEAEAEAPDQTSTIALSFALLGVVPLVTGATMLRGRRRRRKKPLTVYDGWARPTDYRKRAPIWLSIGAVLFIGGGGLFAYEVSRLAPAGDVTEVKRGDMEAFQSGDV